MIRREERRLRETFRRLLLLAVAPAGTLACTSAQPGADAGMDATIAPDGGAGDAISDAPLHDACPPRSAPYFNDASYATYPDAGPDAAPSVCYYFVDLPCTPNYAHSAPPSSCYLFLSDCSSLCTLDAGFFDCRYWEGAGCSDGGVTAQPGMPTTISCGLCNGVGRRPAGLMMSQPTSAAGVVGEYFARASHLEAASVLAFERLRDELAEHGAPRELVGQASRAARDEVRHARVTARLAKRYGGSADVPRVRRRRARTLEQIARENAVEGCVRETFGALIATWQAAHAKDARVRRCMARVAADETRHAALSWAVAAWADSRLDDRARARVLRARRATVERLGSELSADVPSELVVSAGLPDAAAARTLWAAMTRGVWNR